MHYRVYYEVLINYQHSNIKLIIYINVELVCNIIYEICGVIKIGNILS